MRSDEVEDAFEHLLLKLNYVLRDARNQGASALKAGDYVRAETLLAKAKDIEGIAKAVSDLRDSWSEGHGRRPGGGGVPKGKLEGPHLVMTYNRTRAKAMYNRGRVVLLSGSVVMEKEHLSLSDAYSVPRNDLRDKAVLVPGRSRGTMVCMKDIPFRSPSGAAQFVAGCSVSGNREWVLEETGRPLGHWLKAGSGDEPTE